MIDELYARDEVSKMFYDGWVAADWLPMDNGQMPVVCWQGRQGDLPPAQDVPYARFTMIPNLAGQASLAGEDGSKLWSNQGIINVQSFGPKEWEDGFEVAQYMAIIAKRVFQGKASPNGIWFRNCRINEIGPSGGWYQFNTIIEYQFDEQR